MACCVECFVGISMPKMVLRISCHCLRLRDMLGGN